MRSVRAILFFLAIFTIQLLIVTLGYGQGDSAASLAGKLRTAVRGRLPGEIRVQVGDVTTLAPAPDNATVLLVSANPPLGLVSFSADWLEGGIFHSTTGTAVVRAFGRVAVARSPLHPGDPLDESNIVFEERELSSFAQSGYFLRWEQLRHVRSRGYSRPGMVLGAADTELPMPVHRGELVDLIRERGALRIIAKVRALESGQLEQRIRVENLSTHRVLVARVSGAGELTLR